MRLVRPASPGELRRGQSDARSRRRCRFRTGSLVHGRPRMRPGTACVNQRLQVREALSSGAFRHPRCALERRDRENRSFVASGVKLRGNLQASIYSDALPRPRASGRRGSHVLHRDGPALPAPRRPPNASAAAPPEEYTAMKNHKQELDGAFLHIEIPTRRSTSGQSRYPCARLQGRNSTATSGARWPSAFTWCRCSPRKLAPMPLQFANPVWVEDDKSSLDYRVQRLTLQPRHRRS